MLSEEDRNTINWLREYAKNPKISFSGEFKILLAIIDRLTASPPAPQAEGEIEQLLKNAGLTSRDGTFVSAPTREIVAAFHTIAPTSSGLKFCTHPRCTDNSANKCNGVCSQAPATSIKVEQLLRKACNEAVKSGNWDKPPFKSWYYEAEQVLRSAQAPARDTEEIDPMCARVGHRWVQIGDTNKVECVRCGEHAAPRPHSH